MKYILIIFALFVFSASLVSGLPCIGTRLGSGPCHDLVDPLDGCGNYYGNCWLGTCTQCAGPFSAGKCGVGVTCTDKCGLQPDNNLCGPNPLGQCENCNSQDSCYLDVYYDFSCEPIQGMCKFTTDNCRDCTCSCGGYGTNEVGPVYCSDSKDNDCNGLTDCEEKIGCSSESNCICEDNDEDLYLGKGELPRCQGKCGLTKNQNCLGINDCNDDVISGFNINPGKIEDCYNGVDDNCNTKKDCADMDCNADVSCICKDNDFDGWDDCPVGHPHGDGLPADCDDTTAFWWAEQIGSVDNDWDGFGTIVVKTCCTGFFIKPGCALNNRDCNDKNANINPGKKEKCLDWEFLDEDCDIVANCADPGCFCKLGVANGRVVKCGAKQEICNNGFDDDCDELVDCGDPDCKDFSGCRGGGGGYGFLSCDDVSITTLKTMCSEGDGLKDSDTPTTHDACLNRGELSCSGDYNYIEFGHSSETSPYKIPAGEETSFLIDIDTIGKTPITPGLLPADFMFVLDRSGSMKGEIGTAKTALQNIFSYLKNKDTGNSFQAGVVSFNHESQINKFLNFVKLVDLDIPNGCGCTQIATGFDDARTNFEDYGCPENKVKKAVILISDGENNRNGLGTVPNDAVVYTIGINVEKKWADELRRIAQTFGAGGGIYYSINSINELEKVLIRIADRYVASDSADEIVVRIELTNDFEFKDSYLSSEGSNVYNANWISNDGKIIEWNLGKVQKDILKTLKVNVKAKSGIGTGLKQVIILENSFIDVYNECGVSRKPFSLINVDIIADASHKCNDIQRIMKVNTEIQHGALWDKNDVDFPYHICYDDIYGREYIPNEGEDVHTEKNNFIVGLKDGKAYRDNVWIPGTGFAINPDFDGEGVFFGDLDCKFNECPSGYKCVITVSGSDNADIIPCGLVGSYSDKICCKTGLADDAYWTDNNGIRTINAEIRARVKMVWESADLNPGESYTFNIKERDGPLNSDEDIKTIQGISDNGKIIVEWTITQEDWNKGNEDNEMEFYFTIKDGSGTIYSESEIGYDILDDLIVKREVVPGTWTCEKGLYFSHWVKDEESIDTGNQQGSCDGSAYDVSGTCCPTKKNSEEKGWTCSDIEGDSKDYKVCVAPEGIETPCENVRTCSDYNTANFDSDEDAAEEVCTNDINVCAVGKIGSRSTTDFSAQCLPLEGEIKIEDITKTYTKDLCVWRKGECKQNRSILVKYEENEFLATCFNSFGITKGCDEEPKGKMFINVLFEDVDWNNLPNDLNFLNTEKCKEDICGGGKQEFPCFGPVLKLPFFSWIGFIVTGILLILFYWRKFIIEKK